jgi:adenylate cyclase
MRENRKTTVSFIGKTRIVLVLLGIVPFLLVVCLFVYGKLDFSDMVSLFSILGLLSILMGFTLLRKSADHLAHLSRDTRSIESGERSEPISINADQELNEIAANFNSMFIKLNKANREVKEQSVQLMIYARDISESYKRIKEEEELRGRLSRYVGENLVEMLIHSSGGVFLENERREITVLFADIRSFSILAEKMEAEEVVSMLNQFFSVMVDIIFSNKGILDKFIGDRLMALFGLIPSDHTNSCDAIKAAIEMQDAAEELMRKRAGQNKETFEIGIGINTGIVILGNVGSENRMDYTAIGDSVNVASRLEQIARGGEIIIGEQTHHQAHGRFRTRKRGEIQVKNKIKPVVCYKVLRAHTNGQRR